jgi:hypothetical protein
MSSASQKNGPANGAKVVRSVFLSYPVRTDTSVIRRLLEGEGVGVRSDEDIEPGENFRASLIEGMQKADAVIAVLGERPKNSNVFYQMGLADAMGKPVLVVSVGALDPVSDLTLYPYLRARPDDEEALRFGLVHFIRAPHHASKHERDYKTATKPIGEMVDAFLARLHADPSITEVELISIIATAIRESGVDTQASGLHRASAEEITADIAVWSDELESLIGNPLPIEVRSSVMTALDAEGAAKNLMRAIVGAKVRWGLILFLKATADAMGVLGKYPVLAMSIEDFLEGLRKRSFSRIVADLRNQAAHGVRADA